MTERDATRLRKTKKILHSILLVSAILIVGLAGCEEKVQAPAPTPKAMGTCEVFDKLPHDIARPVEVQYNDKVKFLGLTTTELSPNQLKIFYYWQIVNDPGLYKYVFVIFSDKDDKQLAGNEHGLCQNHAFSELKGKFIKETYVVDIPQTAKGQKVNVGIGIYSPEIKADGRLKITAAGKTPVTDNKTRAIVEELNL